MFVNNTPEIFQVGTNHVYPPGNDMIFEDFFYRKFLNEKPSVNRKYIPIQWTNFYISRNYASSDISDLQNYLDKLPRNEKYFTIVQWDDGILNNLKGLDIKIFASGGVGDYPIPLINKPHKFEKKERDIFASFVGAIKGRHRVRENMKKVLENYDGYLVSESMGFHSFKEIMERSVFSLCPRGYGKTSFRINESLNSGAIPVYIFDEPWIPFEDELNFEEYGILIPEVEIQNIDKILKSISASKIENLVQRGREVYEEFYSYDGCYKKIISKLNQ